MINTHCNYSHTKEDVPTEEDVPMEVPSWHYTASTYGLTDPDLILVADNGAGDLLGRAAKVGVGVELHMALVVRAVVYHRHLAVLLLLRHFFNYTEYFYWH